MVKKTYYMHENSIVESSDVGKGTRIWAFAHICKDASIGKNCNIGECSFIESGVSVGNDITIKNGVSVWEGVTIEDKVFIGPNVSFVNDLYPRSKKYYKDRPETLLKEGASIGANSTILCGIKVGKYAMIGAGSVVCEDVPDYALVYGAKAETKGYICACGKKIEISKKKICCICGLKYIIKPKGNLAKL